jgi:hypothetical protein
MPPFSLSDSELDEIMNLAAAIPPPHRDGFLKAVAAALSRYPDECRGAGILHQEAARLQRYYVTAPAPRRRRGATRGYR